MRLIGTILLAGGLALGLGCGKAAQMEGLDKGGPGGRGPGDARANADQPQDIGEAPPAAKLPTRKVVYTADVNLTVEDFDKAQAQLKDLVKQHQGYVAHSEVSGNPGAPRWGRWQVRIPVAGLEAFLSAVGDLGEQQRIALDSRDVTEEYYDLDARIRNKKIEEERLLKHLQQSTGKLEEILAVERELSRVRDEIERSQGRLRLLTNLTDLTTITVSLHERKGYLPGSSPSYGTTVGRTFSGSINTLVDFAKTLLLVVVAALPWLAVLAVVALPLWKLRHRLRPAAGPAEPRVEPEGPESKPGES